VWRQEYGFRFLKDFFPYEWTHVDSFTRFRGAHSQGSVTVAVGEHPALMRVMQRFAVAQPVPGPGVAVGKEAPGAVSGGERRLPLHTNMHHRFFEKADPRIKNAW
jgi:hypothetical protein